MEPKRRSLLAPHMPFVILFVIVLILRSFIIVSNTIPVDDDDAQHGLMAKHIYEQKQFYLYEIANPLHGGAALEAALSAFCFWANKGISDRALQASPLIISMLTLISFYIFSYLWFGRPAALASSVLYAFATPLAFLNFKLYGGYLVILMLTPWIIFLEEKILLGSQINRRSYILLGILAGFGVWTLEIIIPFLFTFGLIWLYVGRTKGWGRSPFYFMAGFIIGYLPSIFYNLTHQYANWKFVLTSGRLHLITYWLAMKLKEEGFKTILFAPFYIYELFRTHSDLLAFIPRFFEPDNEASWLRPISPVAWVHMAIVASIIFYWVIWARRKIYLLFASLVKRKGDLQKMLQLDIKIFLIMLNLAIFILFYMMNPIGCRYLSPIYPWIPLLVSIMSIDFIKKSGFLKIVGQGTILVFIFLSIWGYFVLFSIGQRYPMIDNYVDEKGLHYSLVESSNETVKEVISFLVHQDIHDIYVPSYTTFLFQFVSRENVATAPFLSPSFVKDRYPQVSDTVRRAKRFAIVSFKKSLMAKNVSLELKNQGVGYQSKEIGEFVIYYPLDRGKLSNRLSWDL